MANFKHIIFPRYLAAFGEGSGITKETSGTGNIRPSGNNFIIGTSEPASNINPSQIDEIDIFYFGSFGQNFWNLRMGDGTQKMPGVDSVLVKLGGTNLDQLFWSEINQRYQNNATTDLWATIGVVDELVEWVVIKQ